MKSYGQSCALAKALDLIGDRWTLLIVRELMIREACRYTDLRTGLPGIATNLLAERLAGMERAGLATREEAPPPIATTLFRLTARGKELEPAIAALGRWGAPLLAGSAGDVFRDHWVVLPLRLYVRDRSPEARPLRIGLRAGVEPVTLETVGDGSVRVRPGRPPDADARIEGAPHLILRLLTGKAGLAEAQGKGLRFEGDRKALRRFGCRP
ncbi:MAG: winged helix-turn-helix transcriptional regulator [Candidatus Sulfopaludibacter sp.]|nr:winged helix-turn-helix transcriptional regulator [Candidatus Sulfopaludibacter sp.]